MAGLVKKLDAEIAKAGKGKASAVVVFLSDGDDMKEKIEKFKTDNQLKHVNLGLDGKKGPEAYKIAPEASVTAVLYLKKKVQANHAFEKFDTSDVDKVVKDFVKMQTPAEK